MSQSQHVARVLPSNKLSYFCNLTLLCVTSQWMSDALNIFLYNRPFFNITNHSEAPRGYVPDSTEEDTCKTMKWKNRLQHCNMLLASTLCILLSGTLCWIVLQTLNSYFTTSRVIWHFIYANPNSGTNRSHSKWPGIILTISILIIG